VLKSVIKKLLFSLYRPQTVAVLLTLQSLFRAPSSVLDNNAFGSFAGRFRRGGNLF